MANSFVFTELVLLNINVEKSSGDYLAHSRLQLNYKHVVVYLPSLTGTDFEQMYIVIKSLYEAVINRENYSYLPKD